jgi:hypothetical protein
MRQVSKETAMAFAMGYSVKNSNTRVEFVKESQCSYIYLHNNLIAVKDNNNRKLMITNAGWFTPTTKERLNAILYYCCTNKKIYQSKGQWYICDMNNQSAEYEILWDGKNYVIEY